MMAKKKKKSLVSIPPIDLIRTSNLIQEFIKIRVNESGSKGVVIGLSGGVDSSVTVTLATRALGSKKVLPVFLQNQGSLKSDIEDIEKLCNILKLDLVKYNIQPLIDAFSECVQDKELVSNLEWMNLKPRLLQTTLYFRANKGNYLVCGAGNKSELMIGYFTKYGDGGVDILPIGDVYKTHVFQLAKFLELPESFINKSPSAGLTRGQTDEKEIGMSYNQLDSILYGLETFQTDEDIKNRLNIPSSEVKKVRSMIYKSEHKRRIPIVLKLGVRTPGN
ncbi:MAG: NAD+ synthase, partial [Candidatus Hodarchaeales archaeon]